MTSNEVPIGGSCNRAREENEAGDKAGAGDGGHG